MWSIAGSSRYWGRASPRGVEREAGPDHGRLLPADGGDRPEAALALERDGALVVDPGQEHEPEGAEDLRVVQRRVGSRLERAVRAQDRRGDGVAACDRGHADSPAAGAGAGADPRTNER
jgi:hypothetical protein